MTVRHSVSPFFNNQNQSDSKIWPFLGKKLAISRIFGGKVENFWPAQGLKRIYDSETISITLLNSQNQSDPMIWQFLCKKLVISRIFVGKVKNFWPAQGLKRIYDSEISITLLKNPHQSDSMIWQFRGQKLAILRIFVGKGENF